MKEIGFDIISDLYLSPDDSFNWEGKATSLYCIVAGNITNDTRTLILTLAHLSKFYQGVFFTTGPHDLENKADIQDFNLRLSNSFNKIHNVRSLYDNLVILDGVALVGVNGWYGVERDLEKEQNAHSDLGYLYHSIKDIQKHLNVKRVIVVSGCVPGRSLYFNEEPSIIETQMPLQSILAADTEFKISHWIFGGLKKQVDTQIEGIHYISNPYYKRTLDPKPIQTINWAKRIAIDV